MKLSAKERSKLPRSDFALPGQRKYPVEDKGHAKAAKSRASEMEQKGRISKGTEQKIDRKADAVLGRGHTNVKNASSHEHKLRHG